MMWNDIEEIAEALEDQYSDEDLDDFDIERLQDLVVSLPDFNDNLELMDVRILQAIVDQWILIKSRV